MKKYQMKDVFHMGSELPIIDPNQTDLFKFYLHINLSEDL
jgi:hypothetical protein